MNTLTLVNIEFAAATHLMMSLVLFFFSRRSVQFLSQAWIMLLICLLYCGGLSFFACGGVVPPLGMLHPVMLIYLMICSFLLSVYPLGLCMPGYLQWGRMWGYAIPALCVIFIYGMGAAVGSNLAGVYEFDDFIQYFLSGDILLRIVALLLSGYYILNIFRLPHRLVRRMQLPPDLIAYGSALGAVSIFFVFIAVRFSLVLLNVYVLLFTLVNLFLFFRILRPSVEGMAYPAIREVEKMPTPEEITQSEINDFNEANLKRFNMLEYIMLHEKPFIDTMFNRERLCRLVGFNRHVVLQSLRSQGYNDIHEYISRHRVAELRRLVESGEVTDLKEVDKVGFKTSKTAVVCFERYEGESLVALLEQQARGELAEDETVSSENSVLSSDAPARPS